MALTDRQRLVLMKGPPGIGKSATARALGRALGYPIVDKDDDVLMRHLDPYGAAAYEVMFSQAVSLLGQGFSIIVDSPLRGKAGLDRAIDLAKGVNLNHYVRDEVHRQSYRSRLPQR